jgi:hypothetical protein
MHRTWQLALVLGIAMAGCRASRVESTPDESTAARVATDSAAINRLCAAPDSVRAGLVACVLKDQSAPRPVRSPTPPR